MPSVQFVWIVQRYSLREGRSIVKVFPTEDDAIDYFMESKKQHAQRDPDFTYQRFVVEAPTQRTSSPRKRKSMK